MTSSLEGAKAAMIALDGSIYLRAHAAHRRTPAMARSLSANKDVSFESHMDTKSWSRVIVLDKRSTTTLKEMDASPSW